MGTSIMAEGKSRGRQVTGRLDKKAKLGGAPPGHRPGLNSKRRADLPPRARPLSERDWPGAERAASQKSETPSAPVSVFRFGPTNVPVTAPTGARTAHLP